MEPRVWEGQRRQRGSTATTKAVADADHGIADQVVFRGIIAAATPERALAR
jgi:phage tail protein X